MQNVRRFFNISTATLVACVMNGTGFAQIEPRVGVSAVQADALNAARLGELSTQRQRDLAHGAVRIYEIYSFDRYLTPGSADRSHWIGAMLMPEVGRNIVRVKYQGQNIGHMYRHGRNLSQLISNPQRKVFGVASIGDDGSLSAALDMDGDGIVDFADLRLPDGRFVTMVQRGMGRAFLDAWLLGQNPLCSRASPRVAERSLTQSADPRATLNACPPREIDPAAPTATGPFKGSPGRRTLDPIAKLCEGVDSDSRPVAFVPPDRTDGSIESTLAHVVGGLAYRQFIRWISTPTTLVYTAEEAAAIGAIRLPVYNAVGVFIYITLSAAPTGSASCESGPPGTCAAEAAAARAEIEEEEAADSPPEASTDPEVGSEGEEGEEDDAPPAGPATSGGARVRPEPSDQASLTRYCRMTAGGRTQWQRALHEASQNGYAKYCGGQTRDRPDYGDIFCRTVKRLMDFQPFDAQNELRTAQRCDAFGRCVDDPTSRIRAEFSELHHLTGGIVGFRCNPTVCDPLLLQRLE